MRHREEAFCFVRHDSCIATRGMVCWFPSENPITINRIIMDSTPTSDTVSEASLSAHILNQVDTIVSEAESQTKPLEMEPYRGRIFELFVTANGAGCTVEDAEDDLTADGLCRQLAERWGLKQAAEQSFAQQANLPPAQLQKMRSLWSVMRMWMEWSYAWQRWPEFHSTSTG